MLTETPISYIAYLISLGWPEPAKAIRSAAVVSGPKGGPSLVVQPRKDRGHGDPIDLRLALPEGARVVAGEGAGVIEYSPRSFYVRLTGEQEYENPIGVMAALIEVGATIQAGAK